MSGLRIAGVHKSFGALPVLTGVDLEVATGSFCSILGPSGSGKTTLLRIVAGFERADAGSVVLDDVVLEDDSHALSPDRRGIGYVPQDGSLFPHLTVEGNVGFGLARRARRGDRVSELMAMVDLVGLEHRYPHQLSGGQQQRVALARALAIRPALVLLDEPFSSLDASLRATVRQDVRRVLAEAGTTVLLVTHDQDEALSLSDEVAVINDGQIGQYDTPVGLYVHPISPELARSLGEANLLPGAARGSVVDTALGALALERQGSRRDGELLVLVRPEQIDLVSDGGRGAPEGIVIESEYYGHDAVVRVRGDWADHPLLLVRVADARVLPQRGDRVGLSVRGSVVGWPRGDGDRVPERLDVLPLDGATTS